VSENGLRALIAGRPILVAPGIYDALSALLASQAGFKALYLSGAGIAYTRFGRPDLGLVGMGEVAETLMAIRERVTAPIIVDADTGFGNALNVQRTTKRFARAGADAIQLEDQTFPKRCGHLDEKRVVPTAEMVGKIKAALDARPSSDLLVVARTDAIGPEGLSAALDRADAYCEAGADMLFIEALRSESEIAAAMQRFRERVPLLANIVEGGKTPMKTAAELQAMGFSLAIFPGGTVRFLARGLAEYYGSLARHGTTAPMKERMLDFDGLNALIGTPEMLALGKKYEAE
jgi:2-methylisocitrate lyase-like PEP mutase family enzyme